MKTILVLFFVCLAGSALAGEVKIQEKDDVIIVEYTGSGTGAPSAAPEAAAPAVSGNAEPSYQASADDEDGPAKPRTRSPRRGNRNARQTPSGEQGGE